MDTYSEDKGVAYPEDEKSDRHASSVEDQSLRLDKALSESHGLLSRLTDRLQPCLMPDNPEINDSVVTRESARSALGGRIGVFADSVETLNARLADLLSRVDI